MGDKSDVKAAKPEVKQENAAANKVAAKSVKPEKTSHKDWKFWVILGESIVIVGLIIALVMVGGTPRRVRPVGRDEDDAPLSSIVGNTYKVAEEGYCIKHISYPSGYYKTIYVEEDGKNITLTACDDSQKVTDSVEYLEIVNDNTIFFRTESYYDKIKYTKDAEEQASIKGEEKPASSDSGSSSESSAAPSSSSSDSMSSKCTPGETKSIASGRYEVGVDIKPGTWRIKAPSDLWTNISIYDSKADFDNDDIEDFVMIFSDDGDKALKFDAGQYFTIDDSTTATCE